VVAESAAFTGCCQLRAVAPVHAWLTINAFAPTLCGPLGMRPHAGCAGGHDGNPGEQQREVPAGDGAHPAGVGRGGRTRRRLQHAAGCTSGFTVLGAETCMGGLSCMEWTRGKLQHTKSSGFHAAGLHASWQRFPWDREWHGAPWPQCLHTMTYHGAPRGHRAVGAGAGQQRVPTGRQLLHRRRDVDWHGVIGVEVYLKRGPHRRHPLVLDLPQEV
jgi:hypothetical protein